MAVHARTLYGNTLLWDTHQRRIVHAWGPNVRKVSLGPHYIFASADNLAGWTTTLVEAGASETTVAASAAVNGGALLITTDAAENDGANIQMQGEAFQPAASTSIHLRCKVQISDATQSDLLIGLCITDTDLLGGMTDGIYFRKPDGSTTLSAVLEQDSTETTATAHTVAADTDMLLEIWVDGVTVTFFVNGTELTALAQTNVPDDELLTPSIHFLTGEAVAKTCTIKEFEVWRFAAA